MSDNSKPSFNFKNAKPAIIQIADIVESTTALRVIDKENEEYLRLRDSIEAIGLGKPILVRELKDPVSGELKYGLIDGLQRKTCYQDLGLTEIAAQVGDIEDANVIEAQIIMNAVHVNTKASDYTEALLVVLRANPFLSETELAKRLNVSEKFLQDRLSLKNLVPTAKPSLDDGSLPLMNAYALAKLKPEQQEDLLNQAKSKDATEFVPIAHQLFKANKEDKSQGKKTSDEFVPIPKLQRLTTITEELDTINKSKDNSKLLIAVKQAGITTVEDAVKYTLEWTRHMDPINVAAAKAKREADKAAVKADKEKKKAEADKAKTNAVPTGVAVAFK